MRKPLVVLGLASVTLAAGGLTVQAPAHQPSDTPDTARVERLSGTSVLPAGEHEPDSATTSAGWGAVPVPASPAGAVRTPSLPSSIGSPSEDSSGGNAREAVEPGDPAEPADRAGRPRHRDVEAGPLEDVIAASRKAVSAASVAPGVQAPVQQQILALVNQHRRKAGCEALTVDRRLVDAANGHAADMARRGYFDHESPGGDRAGSRVTEAGYRWSRFGENIAKGQDSPYEVMTDWMESPSHRENILDCRLDQMGVGLALDSGDTPYWVQDFATPR